MHGRRLHLDDPRDTRRTQLGLTPDPFDPTLHHTRCAPRTPMRTARPIPQTRIALSPPTPPPLVRGRPRDPHLRRNMRDRPTTTDPLNQLLATMNRQPGVSVHSGPPRVACVSWRLAHLLPEAPFTRGPCQQRRWSAHLGADPEARTVSRIAALGGGPEVAAAWRPTDLTK